MAMDPELSALLQDSATIEPFASEDDDDLPTYAAGRAVTCRYRKRSQVRRDLDGEDYTTQGDLLIDGDDPVTRRDRVTTPDGEVVFVREVSKARDEVGAIHHTRVFLGSQQR